MQRISKAAIYDIGRRTIASFHARPAVPTVAFAALLIAIVAVASPLTRPSSAEAATKSVTVANFSFTDVASSTTTTTINAGDSVTWTWAATGGIPHNVCSGNSCVAPTTPANTTDPWTSGALAASPHSYTRQFNTGGTYKYECEQHNTMVGTIVVQASTLAGSDRDAVPSGDVAAASDATADVSDRPMWIMLAIATVAAFALGIAAASYARSQRRASR